jgi:hypothetical protein
MLFFHIGDEDSLTLPKGENIMIANNLMGGASIAFGVLSVLAIANILTSYVLPEKQTLTGFIESKTGLPTTGGVA